MSFLQPYILSILRLVTGLIFLEHGTGKWLGFPSGPGIAHGSFSNFSFLSASTSGLFELVGGALIVLGLFTRPVAFILSGVMAVAYWTAHAPRSLYPVLNGGDAAILYCFVFLYLFAAGGGCWSLDKLFGLEKKP